MKQFILIFSFLFFLNHHAHSNEAEELALQNLNTAFQSPYIYNSVNVITGDYCEIQTDLAFNDKSFVLRRLYNSNDRFSQGWVLNLPLLNSDSCPEEEGVTYIKDNQNRIIEISQENGKTLKLTYDNNKIHIESSESQWVTYTYKVDQTQYGTSFLITHVETSDDAPISYHYRNHPIERRKLITKREIGEGEYQLIDYYDISSSEARDPLRDTQIGKVKELRAPVGTDDTSYITQRFVYHDTYTEVFDVYDRKSIYRFGTNYLLEAIENYDEKDILYRTETYHWDDENRLVKKSLLDGCDNSLISHEYTYNENDQVATHTLRGNLSGTNTNETYTTRYKYNKDGTLLSFEEDNGYGKRFLYSDNQKPIASFILDHGQIKIRNFYKYDEKDHLIQTIKDDGQSDKCDDLKSATERYMTKITLENGLPATINEYAYDFSIHDYRLLNRTCNSYSNAGKLIHQDLHDANGDCVTYAENAYDDRGRLIFSKDFADEIQDIDYDLNGRIISIQTPQKTVTCDYDFAGRLISHTQIEDGKQTSYKYEYDFLGNKVETVDIFGNSTHYLYDCFNRLVETIHPEVSDENGNFIRPATKIDYDCFDRIVKQTDAKGFETCTKYNARGKPISVFHPDGTFETFEYNLDGSLKKATDKYGNTTFYTRDFLGRITCETTIDANQNKLSEKKSLYNAFHLLETHSDLVDSYFSYDFAGRKASVIENEIQVEYIYNATGQICSQIKYLSQDPNDYIKINFEQTLSGNVLAMNLTNDKGSFLKEADIENEKEQHIEFFYDFYNQRGQSVLRTETTDSKGVITETIYDTIGRPEIIRKKSPFGQLLAEKHITYDVNGNIVCERHETGDKPFVIKRSYGPKNQLRTISENDRTTSYVYNNHGEIATIIQPNGIELYHQYNGAGRLITLQSNDNTVDYSYFYNSYGQLIEVQDHIYNSRVKRDHNKRGSVICESIETKDTQLIVKKEFDDFERPVKLTLPDSSSIQYIYEDVFLKQIKRLDQKGQILYTHTYSEYDKKAQVQSQEFIGNLGYLHYKRDDQNQLITINSTYFEEKILYDEYNHIIETKTPLSQSTMTYDDLDQVIDDSGHSYEYDMIGRRGSLDSFEYDLNGNLIFDGDNSYTYDALNRLLSIETDTQKIHYSYDAFHRRLTETNSNKDTIFFLYDGDHEIGTVDNIGTTKQLRVLGVGHGAEIGASVALEIDDKIYAPIHNSRGHISCLVNLTTKKAVEYLSYSVFGEQTIYDANGYEKVNSISPWGYFSKRHDRKTGLVAFGKRYYKPTTGSFITKDPMGYPDGPNAYKFLNNNPLSHFDLYGLFSFSDFWDSIVGFGKKCYNFFTQAIHTFQYYIGFYDYIYPDLVKIGEATVGKTYLLLAGFYTDNSETGVHGKGELVDNVRITMINGILNSRQDYKMTLEKLSDTHGGMNIHYIFHATDGFAWDLLKGFFIKFGYTSPEARILAKTWKELIEEMGGVNGDGTIYHYAHSIGAANTLRAKALLSEEEQKMIHVITIGGATMIKNDGFASVTNYISFRDGVPLFDPIGYVRGALGSDDIELIGTPWGIPLIDHPLNMYTYVQIIEKLGQQFVKRYGL